MSTMCARSACRTSRCQSAAWERSVPAGFLGTGGCCHTRSHSVGLSALPTPSLPPERYATAPPGPLDIVLCPLGAVLRCSCPWIQVGALPPPPAPAFGVLNVSANPDAGECELMVQHMLQGLPVKVSVQPGFCHTAEDFGEALGAKHVLEHAAQLFTARDQAASLTTEVKNLDLVKVVAGCVLSLGPPPLCLEESYAYVLGW